MSRLREVLAICWILFGDKVLAFQTVWKSDDVFPLFAHPQQKLEPMEGSTNRRNFVGTSMALLGVGLTGSAATAAEIWNKDPVNKRTGVTVSDAENMGFNVAFVTYLTRFLLSFDPNVQKFWFSLPIPREKVQEVRVEQFAALAASVEVGLMEDYGETNGTSRLLQDLLQRYAPELDDPTLSKRQRREIKEARRQIALMFALLEKNQPTKELTRLLALVDNGSVSKVEIIDKERLWTKQPEISFPASPSGGENVTGSALLELEGSVVSITADILPSLSSPTPTRIEISPPKNGGTTAMVRLEGSKLKVTNGGSGYLGEEHISITIGNETSEAQAELGFRIKNIEIMNPGSGYAVEKPIKVMAKEEQLAWAYPRAEKTSYSSFRKSEEDGELLAKESSKFNVVSAAVSGPDDGRPPLPFWTSKSSSAELLTLLPAGVGLEYDRIQKRYKLAVDGDFQKAYPNAFQTFDRKIDIQFGPRGRAPIERDMDLDLGTYLRFCASGAICASSVHLALTPLDVVKTKVQTAPDVYSNIGSAFGTVWKEEGPSTFFTGWLPTLAGNFAGGGVLYALTELIRRSLSQAAGADALTYEVPIILAAAVCSSAVGAALSCPFEAVRIRTVAQPDFASNSIETLKRILREEGLGSLLNAIPVFLAKNVPYASAKFLVFDLSTERLLEAFPAANEDLKLSLLVTLVGGILGGTAAAMVSNPADAVISEMKKDKAKISPQDAARKLIERAGVNGLFTGLSLRIVFYSLIASLQFVVYDGVRFALGIGPDDLKLYLDVLGGALQQPGSGVS